MGKPLPNKDLIAADVKKAQEEWLNRTRQTLSGRVIQQLDAALDEMIKNNLGIHRQGGYGPPKFKGENDSEIRKFALAEIKRVVSEVGPEIVKETKLTDKQVAEAREWYRTTLGAEVKRQIGELAKQDASKIINSVLENTYDADETAASRGSRYF